MSTIAPEPPRGTDAPPTSDRSELTELTELRHEVERQGDSIRSSQRAFSIFAFGALLIALMTFFLVITKLDAKSTNNAPAAAAAHRTAMGHTVGVRLGEFFVRPSAAAAAAGQVRFMVHNGGTATHEFVVLRTDKPAGSLLKGARADESGNAGETGDLAPGAAKTITLKLGAGHYALICNLPGHYKAGQHTDFTVR